MLSRNQKQAHLAQNTGDESERLMEDMKVALLVWRGLHLFLAALNNCSRLPKETPVK